MDSSAKKTVEKRWTAPEELTLIDLVISHEEELFGCHKGPVSSSTGRTEQRRALVWAEIAETLNSRHTIEKRSVEKVKKKFHNIKQRAKEKIDEARKQRGKIGGGPEPLPPTPAEEALINVCGNRPGMRGLNGIDTDLISSGEKPVDEEEGSTSWTQPPNIPLSSSTATTSRCIDAGKKTTKRRKNILDEATLLNIEFDNKRLKGELQLQEQKLKTLKSQQAAFDSLNLYLSLKISSEYNISCQPES